MELAAFVVQAVLVEGRSVREVARAHGVSKTWLYELIARYSFFILMGLLLTGALSVLAYPIRMCANLTIYVMARIFHLPGVL